MSIELKSGTLIKLFNRSGIKLSLSFTITVLIMTSFMVMLVNPALGGNSTPQTTDPTSFSVPSTKSQSGKEGEFATLAAISSITAKQSNNIVNTRTYYDVTFTTASGGSIKDIIIDFPSGTGIGVSGLLVERQGIGVGTAAKTGPLQITYTVTDPIFIPAGTMIRLELSSIDNPPNAGASYKVTVTTKRPAGTTIDGPTPSATYKIKQIGTNDITDNSITSSKPAESFMKKVILSDDDVGHDLGWNPDGDSTLFGIFDTAIPPTGPITSFISIMVVDSIGATPENHFCDVVRLTPSAQTFSIACSTPPNDQDELQYVIENLPPFVP
jgi:hypothetical protein